MTSKTPYAKTQIRILKDDLKRLHDLVPGTNDTHKMNKLINFWERNYGKTTMELMGDDMVRAIEKMIQKQNGR